MGVPKYIINLEDFAKLWSDLDIRPGFDQAELEQLGDKLQEGLAEVADLLRQLLEPKDERQFRSMDMSRHIPAIVNVYVMERKFLQQAYLTGITFSQTGWNAEDTISLEIGGVLIIDHIHTKELGQQKMFRTFLPVNENEEVRILYDNVSGHSKMFFCEIDFVFL